MEHLKGHVTISSLTRHNIVGFFQILAQYKGNWPSRTSLHAMKHVGINFFTLYFYLSPL